MDSDPGRLHLSSKRPRLKLRLWFTNARRLFLAACSPIFLMALVRGAELTAVFSTAPESVASGGRATVWLNVLNHSNREVL